MTNARLSVSHAEAPSSASRRLRTLRTQWRNTGKMPPHGTATVSLALVVLAATLAGCDASAECEKKRLDVFRAWQSVHEAAYERKLAGVDEATWTTIETKTDLLQSAFATQQVTWDSANKASGELEQLTGVANTDAPVQLEVFKTSAAEARAKQKAFFEACR